MTKFLSKWFRKFHRWIAVPTALAIPLAVVIKLIGNPEMVANWEKLDKIPSILMLIMAISGTYLFLLPYITMGQRKKNRANKPAAASLPRPTTGDLQIPERLTVWHIKNPSRTIEWSGAVSGPRKMKYRLVSNKEIAK